MAESIKEYNEKLKSLKEYSENDKDHENGLCQ